MSGNDVVIDARAALLALLAAIELALRSGDPAVDCWECPEGGFYVALVLGVPELALDLCLIDGRVLAHVLPCPVLLGGAE